LKIEQVSPRTWKVESNEHEYLIWFDHKGFNCNCPYFIRNPGKICKHIRYLIKSLPRRGKIGKINRY